VSIIYMFKIIAAPPKRAAAPTAPVFMGAAKALVLELVAAPEAVAALGALAIAEEGVGIPLVNGTADTELAPEKTGACVLAVRFGVAVVSKGLSTLDACQRNSSGEKQLLTCR
jgi:hypothetical protein